MVKKTVAYYLKDKLLAKSRVSQSFIEEAVHSQIVDKLPAHYPSWTVAKAAGELYQLLVDVGMVESLVIYNLINRLLPVANIEPQKFYTETYLMVVDILPAGCLSEDVAEAARKLYEILLDASKEGRRILRKQWNANYKAKRELSNN